MRLARARSADAPRLAAILREWARATPWMPDLHAAAEDARVLDRLIAAGAVITLRDWRGTQGFLARDGECVHALYLRPGARGRGHGRRLLDAAKARSDRLELWTFQRNARARAFYARAGFAEVERTDGSGNDAGLPDMRMVWTKE